MPRNTTVFQIFVASPSDVQDERDLLENIISELNTTWSKNLGVMFELLRWETNVYPALSTDPQSVINSQIGTDYDIFIGILWGRFGIPTPRFQSGTMEEFERAYSKYNNDNQSLEIMFYFKDTPIPPFKIDTNQLQKVKDFRDSLSEKGGLYSTFDDISGFESSLRAHLSYLAQKFSSKEHLATSQNHSTTHPNQETLEENADDFGFLDYLELYEERTHEMIIATSAITDATMRIGEQMTQRTKEIQSAGAINDIKIARKLIKHSADDLNSYSDNLSRQLPLLTTSREKALLALSSALGLFGEFSDTAPTALLDMRSSVSDFLTTTIGTYDSTRNFQETIQSLPRLTVEINKAKRLVVAQLSLVLSEINNTKNTLQNILESIDKILEYER